MTVRFEKKLKKDQKKEKFFIFKFVCLMSTNKIK